LNISRCINAEFNVPFITLYFVEWHHSAFISYKKLINVCHRGLNIFRPVRSTQISCVYACHVTSRFGSPSLGYPSFMTPISEIHQKKTFKDRICVVSKLLKT